MSTYQASLFGLRGTVKCYSHYREAYYWRKLNFKGAKHYATRPFANMQNTKKSTVLLGLAGVSVGALFGAGYSYHKLQKSHINGGGLAIQTECAVLDTLPDFPVSRQVISPVDNTGLKLRLYQYPTCPFCCKVRAFLDYYGLSYEVIEVNPVLRQQISWSSYKKVPIILAEMESGYQQLNDSSMIISALASYLHDRDRSLQDVVKYYPNITYDDDSGTSKTEILNRYFLMFHSNVPEDRTKEVTLLETKWRKWADDVLVHVLSPNVYRTREEAFQAFNWFSEVGEWEKHFSPWERYLMVYVGAYAMWIISKRLKKRHNLKENVRQSLYDECNVWLKAIKKQGATFLGGKSPNLADLAVYGVLSSIEGCKAFQDLLDHTKIGSWYQAMQENVKKHLGGAVMNR